MKQTQRKPSVLSVCCLILPLLLPLRANAQWFEFTTTAMTTQIELEFWVDDASSAWQIRDQVFASFAQIDQQMSRYQPDSEVSRVNQQAAQRPVVVSDRLFQVIQEAQRISALSDGAFDISFASVGHLYDFRAGIQPTAAKIQTEIPHINYHDIQLDAAKRSIFFRKAGLMIDLGGIAKGYSVDLGIRILQQHGVQNARLSAGGDMRLLGDKRGKPWIVGVRDPRSESQNAVLLPLSDIAISTSGDYERFFINEAGERIHHILSPKTGKPAQGIQSVTLIGYPALTTDGLSTAVFVLGVKDGLALINRLPGLDAIIIDADRKMHYSDGLMAPDSR